MFKAEEMSKLTIVGPKSLSMEVIETLHKLKVYHIVDQKKTEDIDIGSPLESSEEISNILVKIRAIISFLGIDQENAVKSRSGNLPSIAAIRSKIEKLDKFTSDRSSEIKGLNEQLRILGERKSTLMNISQLGISLENLCDYESIDMIIGILENSKDIDNEIKRITGRYTLYSSQYALDKSKRIIALFIEKGKRFDAFDALSKRGFSEIDMSFIKESCLKGDASKEISRIDKDTHEIRSKLSQIDKEISGMRKEWKDYLIEMDNLLSIEAEKAEAPLRFGATEKAFIIKGWVPSKKLSHATAELNKAANNRILIQSEKVHHDDEVPVLLRNPKLVSSFEWFMDLYTLPKYGEIDPTFIMFLTFPIFYGFMLGDIGYGLVTLALFLYLRNKFGSDFRRLINAMMLASVVSIIFGVVFGEVFGLESIMGHELPRLIARSEQTKELMVIAIAIGAAHLNLGLLVGFYNELKHHGFVKAVLEKISWIILELGVAAVAASYMNILILIPGTGFALLPRYVGFTIIGLAVVMIYLGEGAKGIVELPSIFSQMMSYARLMAVGLASVILAVVVNDLAGKMFSAGIVGIIGGIILLIVGHSINIGLGILGPFLHSVRLHYVEFFTKFFQGGGMRYTPFGEPKEVE